MTPTELAAFALALPDALEAPHFDRRSFRVGTKIFVTMTANGDEAMVRVSPDGIEALLAGHPDVFFGYGGWTTNNGALGVRLAKVDRALMKRLVTDSWRRIAPKKLVAAFDGDAAKAPAAKPRRPSAAKAKKTSTKAKKPRTR